MKTDTKTETISLSEFARQMKVGEKTIRDAVKLGKLSKGVIQVNGKSKIIFDIAKQEFEAFRIGVKAKPKDKPANNSTDKPLVDGSKMSYAEATRRNAVFKARLSELEVMEKEKILVNKADVDSQLFEFHQEIKKSLLAIPDRIVDTLLSFDGDRNKTHELIYESISLELDKLARLTD